MNYKIAATGLLVLTLTTCSSPAGANIKETPNVDISVETDVTKIFTKETPVDLLSQDYFKKQTLMNNSVMMESAINKLKKYVGKTWYVFSGNTPSGWDCSGLTMWFYQQVNIDLEHRASKQQYAGTKTTNPMPGDIVIFKYKGYKSAYHVGIYIGDGLMIHAPRKGEVTRIESISEFGGDYSNISYRSLVERI